MLFCSYIQNGNENDCTCGFNKTVCAYKSCNNNIKCFCRFTKEYGESAENSKGRENQYCISECSGKCGYSEGKALWKLGFQK